MGWGDIASAFGSATKTTLLTAPETPESRKKLFLDQEASKRKREELEASEEARRNKLSEQRLTDREEWKIDNQDIVNTHLQGMGYNPVIPTGVQQVNQHVETQNQQASAISNSQNQNIDWATYHSQAKGGGYMSTAVHSQEQIDTMSGRWQASAQKDRDAWLAGGGGLHNASKGRSWD